MNRLKVVWKIILVIGLSVMLFACSKVSRENFEKIKPGMTLQEVVSILGEPTGSESVDIAGVTGTAATWKRGETVINIHFLSGQVLVKTFDKPTDGHNPD